MGAYILKRILLMIPTLLGIMVMTFAIVQFVPGGPIERIIAQVQGTAVDATARFGGGTGGEVNRAPEPGAVGSSMAVPSFRWTVTEDFALDTTDGSITMVTRSIIASSLGSQRRSSV